MTPHEINTKLKIAASQSMRAKVRAQSPGLFAAGSQRQSLTNVAKTGKCSARSVNLMFWCDA